jgi:hypothetical protein
MIEPTLDDIGRRVVYIGNRFPGGQLEYGVIKLPTQFTVFVTYEGDNHAKGTRREDLEWADGTGNESAKAGEAA